MDRPDLSVLLVTHNGKERALATIESARRAVGSASTEWFVVDCGSTDGTPAAIGHAFADVNLVRQRNIGFAAGNNVALRRASGRYVLLLNPDVDIVEGTFQRLVEALDRRPTVGAASVVQRGPGGALIPSIGRFPSTIRQMGEALRIARIPGLQRFQEMEKRPQKYAQERSVDWVVGAFLVVRAEVVEAVGGLDERYFLYSEETDWCYRIRQAGWDVRHLPVMEIVHHAGGYDGARLAQLTYSKMLFARKHCGPVRRAGIHVGLILRHTIRLAAFQGRSGERGQRAGRERQALAVALGESCGLLGATTGRDA